MVTSWEGGELGYHYYQQAYQGYISNSNGGNAGLPTQWCNELLLPQHVCSCNGQGASHYCTLVCVAALNAMDMGRVDANSTKCNSVTQKGQQCMPAGSRSYCWKTGSNSCHGHLYLYQYQYVRY